MFRSAPKMDTVTRSSVPVCALVLGMVKRVQRRCAHTGVVNRLDTASVTKRSGCASANPALAELAVERKSVNLGVDLMVNVT